MKNIIGREREIALLNECINSKQAEFVAIYGRRRVGKTFLVREFFNYTFSFYATGIANLKTKKQLSEFNRALLKYGGEDKTNPTNWFDAFSRLEKIIEKKDVYREYSNNKIVVFLDELPWFDSAKSDFKQALEWFWNSYASTKKDLVFIVCGSATSWIVDNLLKNTGGLHNRVTRRINLMPFTLRECELFFKNNNFDMTRHQMVESYMIFGGVPYYLNCLDSKLSISQNVDNLLYKEYGELRNEFEYLYASLFKKPEQYIQVIRMLSKRKAGITRKELLDGSKLKSGGHLTKILNNLEQCGFIRKYKNSPSGKKDFYYQLIDSYTLFYLNNIESSDVESWLSFIDTPSYYVWAGLAFERVCLLHSEQIKEKLGVSGIRTNEYSFRSSDKSNGTQIDLVIDRSDSVINLCEMKYSYNQFEIDSSYSKQLLNKKEVFRQKTNTKKSLFITMITSFGVKKNRYYDTISNELTEDDLFIK